jgi:5-methylthioadenosine/S-adenosylhomocysteine deaminase
VGQLPYHIHLHETRAEVDDSRTGTPSMSRHRSEALLTPVENFARLGLLSPRLVAVHMTQLTDHEIQLLAAAKGGCRRASWVGRKN